MKADVELIVWILSWGAHALVTAPWQLFHANTFHPSTLSLAYSESLLGYAPVFAPVYWATGNPLLATNALIIATHPLCAVAMYALVRRYAGATAAAVAAFFYAFCTFRLWSLSHLHMLGIQYLPLVVLFTDRWLEEARPRAAVLLAVTFLLQALSSYYLFYALLLLYVPAGLLLLARHRTRIDRRRLLGLAAALGFALAVFGALSLPYLHLQRLGLIPSYTEQEGPPQIGLIPWFGHRDIWRYLTENGVGPIGFTLAGLALLPPWRRLRTLRILGLSVALVGFWASFGSEIDFRGSYFWSPYQLLVEWVPGLSSVRKPSRFVIVGHFGLVVLVGVAVERLLGGLRAAWRWSIAGALVTVALATYTYPAPAIAPHPFPTWETLPPPYRWLAEHGEGRPLVEIPGSQFWISSRRMYLSIFHRLPIIEGYTAYPPETDVFLHEIADRLPSARALQELVDHIDVGWVLVHRELLLRPQIEAWEGTLPSGLERVADWPPMLLLRVTRQPRDDRRARLLDEHRTVTGTPLSPTGRCPGRLALAEPLPERLPMASTVRLQVRIENDGTTPWPAFGFVPRYLVRLRACLRPSDQTCQTLLISLRSDVHPHQPLTVPIKVDTGRPGEYVLDVELLQVGVGSLAKCGVAPLRVPALVDWAVEQPPS